MTSHCHLPQEFGRSIKYTYLSQLTNPEVGEAVIYLTADVGGSLSIRLLLSNENVNKNSLIFILVEVLVAGSAVIVSPNY